MIDIATAKLLAAYNLWADQTLFAAVTELTDGAVYQKTKTLFGSMLGTLNHNYQVDLIWQAHLSGRQHGFTSRRETLHARFEALVAAQFQIDAWFIDWVEQQTPHTLAHIQRFSFTSGQPAQLSKGMMFLHVINHKTYHRGWVSQMFFEFDAHPPETDLSVFMTREKLEDTP